MSHFLGSAGTLKRPWQPCHCALNSGARPSHWIVSWLQARFLATEWSLLCNHSDAGNPIPLVVPIFPVSCVSGMGLAPLHAFLAHLNLPSLSPSLAPSADMPRPPPYAESAAASPPAVPPQRACLSSGNHSSGAAQHGGALRPNGIGLTGALQNSVEPTTAAEPCQVIFQVDHGSGLSGLAQVPAVCGLPCMLPDCED